jgi:hypothetical protein
MSDDELVRIARQYRQRGVIVDTNLLLLLLVGSVNLELILKFDRTQSRGFTVGDFTTLVDFLAQFETVVTTSHILTETCNFLFQIKGDYGRMAALAFARLVAEFRERRPESRRLVAAKSFLTFGLTDAAILDVKPGRHLVVTVDAKLVNRLCSNGVAAVNFNHLRRF